MLCITKNFAEGTTMTETGRTLVKTSSGGEGNVQMLHHECYLRGREPVFESPPYARHCATHFYKCCFF